MLIKSFLVGRHVRAKLTLKFLNDKRIKINLHFIGVEQKRNTTLSCHKLPECKIARTPLTIAVTI